MMTFVRERISTLVIKIITCWVDIYYIIIITDNKIILYYNSKKKKSIRMLIKKQYSWNEAKIEHNYNK
jgi:hypothetical protein